MLYVYCTRKMLRDIAGIKMGALASKVIATVAEETVLDN
jgi:hypothetical protein